MLDFVAAICGQHELVVVYYISDVTGDANYRKTCVFKLVVVIGSDCSFRFRVLKTSRKSRNVIRFLRVLPLRRVASYIFSIYNVPQHNFFFFFSQFLVWRGLSDFKWVSCEGVQTQTRNSGNVQQGAGVFRRIYLLDKENLLLKCGPFVYLGTNFKNGDLSSLVFCLEIVIFLGRCHILPIHQAVRGRPIVTLPCWKNFRILCNLSDKKALLGLIFEKIATRRTGMKALNQNMSIVDCNFLQAAY